MAPGRTKGKRESKATEARGGRTSVLLLSFPFSFFQRCLTDPSITLHYIPYVWLVIIERFIRSTAAIAILIHRIDLTIVTSCASRRVASISPTWRGTPQAWPPARLPTWPQPTFPPTPHTHSHTLTHLSVSGCGTPYRPGKCAPAATADCTLHMHLLPAPPTSTRPCPAPAPATCNLHLHMALAPAPAPAPARLGFVFPAHPKQSGSRLY